MRAQERMGAAIAAVLCVRAAAAAPSEAGSRFAALRATLGASAPGGRVDELRSGRLIRCHFEGDPELEEADAEGGYFAHQFSRAECGGALPGPTCMGAIHSTYHCGQDEQWSVLAAGEGGRKAPTARWFNYLPCPGDLAQVTVDFFCPNADNRVHLYHCAHDGPAERLPTTPVDALTAKPLPGNGPGRYRHFFTHGQCKRATAGGAPGLPPHGKVCVTSMRSAVHCGGDHDWAVGNNSAPSHPGMTWFTSHRCDAAHVAADYFCPNDAHRHLHRCTYQGPGDADPDCAAAQVRHANYPAAGACLRRSFRDNECTNGPPPRDRPCLVSIKEAAQCGQEQDFKASDAHEDPSGRAAVRWWNQEPCGDARVVVDYYCPPRL